jgi:hypothetical protein
MTTLKQLAEHHGLTIVVRGTQYARLELGGKRLAVFRGVGWEWGARAWIDGWSKSQLEHTLELIAGAVAVAGRPIKYHWVVPATLARAFAAGAARWATQHVVDELERGATRGQMSSHECDGGHAVVAHGWWWCGDEEEDLREKEEAAAQARSAAVRAYLDELERVCMTVNAMYDAVTAAGGVCFLERDGKLMGRIRSNSQCRYHWIAVHLSAGRRRHTIRLAPKWVGGTGAGKYTISTAGGRDAPGLGISPSRDEITIPCYPGIEGDRGVGGMLSPDSIPAAGGAQDQQAIG